MKFLPFLSIILFGLMISVTACGGESATKAEARESLGDVKAPAPAMNTQQPAAPGNATIPPPAPPAEPAQNDKGVWHFTCAKGHPGGGGSAADKCGNCGDALTHNQEYHAQ